MTSALLIVFREVIEAGLIVGIVLAATTGVPGRARAVAGGVIAGVLGACLVAAFAGEIANLFQGSGQELFNAAILLLAVAMLTWHNVWMASHGREMARELKAAGHKVRTGERTLTALSVWWGWRCCAKVRKWCCFSTASRRRAAPPPPLWRQAADLALRQAR